VTNKDRKRLRRFFLKKNKKRRNKKRKLRPKKMEIIKMDVGGKIKVNKMMTIKGIKNSGLVFNIRISTWVVC
jgi:hypothetical protein